MAISIEMIPLNRHARHVVTLGFRPGGLALYLTPNPPASCLDSFNKSSDYVDFYCSLLLTCVLVLYLRNLVFRGGTRSISIVHCQYRLQYKSSENCAGTLFPVLLSFIPTTRNPRRAHLTLPSHPRSALLTHGTPPPYHSCSTPHRS